MLLLNENQYHKSFKFFKKLNGLEQSHINYSIKYLYSLTNSGNLSEAFNFSKKLEKQNQDSFESNLIMGVFYLKNSNFRLAKKYFLRAKNKNSKFMQIRNYKN
jgi:tetratricopeptide (TPR) repeat protein